MYISMSMAGENLRFLPMHTWKGVISRNTLKGKLSFNHYETDPFVAPYSHHLVTPTGPKRELLTPTNDEKRERQMGPSPYKHDETVPCVVSFFCHLS